MPTSGEQIASGDSVSTVIALLGRREVPTDGVDDNCTFLAQALARRGHTLNKVRVEWAERGSLRALFDLWRQSAQWRGCWVMLQFTSLAWSRYGFPFSAWVAMKILRWRGAHTAVFYHEPEAAPPRYPLDRIRSVCQAWVIRRLYFAVERPIFADPLTHISWLPKNDTKSVFIPIGASVPQPPPRSAAAQNGSSRKTVAVYCLSEAPYRSRELEDIGEALRCVSGNGLKIRVVFLGRGTDDAKEEINRALGALPLELVNLGLQSAESVSRWLGESDVMLCVRGQLFPRRSSAIAGIACGVPIVAYAGGCEGTHVAEAGVDLVPYRDQASLGNALKQLLEDRQRWEEFHRRSVRVQQEYLSWDGIADRFVKAFGLAQG